MRNSATHRPIVIPVGGIELAGELSIPKSPTGLVVFAHGSGSSRFSPRNRQVALSLQHSGIATLLFDLLTVDEERIDAADATLRFDVDFLADRLIGATDWVDQHANAGHLPIGYFGASTGAAAALMAAARRPRLITGIVSRGGRPDLAGVALTSVRAPTLLIVGGNDRHVLELNRSAAARMTAPRRIEIVPNASHLFEEPGALERVANLASEWFATCFDTAVHSEVRP
jgi:putative phosphoribosyl transferase